MKKWVKIKKGENQASEIATGKNTKFLKKLGFKQVDVEESEKGGWWRKGKAPTFTDEEIIENEYVADKQIRDNEMTSLTVEIDGYVLQADEAS